MKDLADTRDNEYTSIKLIDENCYDIKSIKSKQMYIMLISVEYTSPISIKRWCNKIPRLA